MNYFPQRRVDYLGKFDFEIAGGDTGCHRMAIGGYYGQYSHVFSSGRAPLAAVRRASVLSSHLKYEPTQINRSNFTIQALSWAAQQVIVVEPLVQTSDIHDREVSLALPNDQSFLCVGDFGALMRWILIKTMIIQWNYHNFYHSARRIDDYFCGIF